MSDILTTVLIMRKLGTVML